MWNGELIEKERGGSRKNTDPWKLCRGFQPRKIEGTPAPSPLEGEMCMLAGKFLTYKIGMKLLPSTVVVRVAG